MSLHTSVRILDYGVGNLRSVYRACKIYSDDVEIASGETQLTGASHLVLPGVGAFGVAMKGIREQGLETPIKEWVQAGKPLIGICVGLQILFELGHENGLHEGIGIWKGNVVHLRKFEIEKRIQIPNIGWSAVFPTTNNNQNSILRGLHTPFYAYFAHSYGVETENTKDVTGYINLTSKEVPVVFEDKNVFGVQFHPEKSGEIGLKIISNFLAIPGKMND